MANLQALKIVYGVVKWSTFLVLALTLLLILHKAPAPKVPYDPNAGTRVQEKFAAADQAKAAGEPAKVQLDRTELNSYLRDNLELEGQNQPRPAGTSSESAAAGGELQARGGPGAQSNPAAAVAGDEQATLEQVQSSVKDVKIDMDGDLVKAYVIFDFHGKDLSLELDGHLGAQDGYLHFDPVAGKLGSLPLPQSTLDAAVEKLMSSPENREKLKLPDDIGNLQIVNGQVVVTYK
jgi:hypothetical protein